MLVLAALALVPRLILGLHLVNAIVPPRMIGRLLKICIAGPIGIGVSSLLSFVWIWAGLDLGLYAVLEAAAIGLLTLFILWRNRPRQDRAWNIPRITISREHVPWILIVVAGAILALGVFAFATLRRPHGSIDAWLNWNVVARFVYLGGREWYWTFQRMWDQPGYPFLLAMTNATTWELLGLSTPRAPAVLALFFTASLAAVLFATVRELRGWKQASLAATVALSFSSFAWFGAAQLADVPLACYFLISAAMLLLYARSRLPSVAVLGGLAAGLGAWTKDEGLAFAVMVVFPWLLLSASEGGRGLKRFLLGAAGPLILVGLFKILLAPPSYLFLGITSRITRLIDPAQYWLVIRETAVNLAASESDALFLVLGIGLYCLFVGRTRTDVRGLTPLALLIGLQLLAYFGLYVLTPFDPAWQVRTSVGRLYLHVLPMIILALFLWLRSPEELRPQAG